MQLPPHHLLQGFVKHYLIIDQKISNAQSYRMFSDGNPGIVFHLKDPFLQLNDENSAAILQPQSFVYGQLSHHNTILIQSDLKMIVVVLAPCALFTHFDTAAYELNDETAPLAIFFGQEARDVEEQLITTLSTADAIAIIERFLINRLTPLRYLTTDFSMAIRSIYQHHGLISIEDLLQTLPITERQLERKFREYVGTSPKRFADTIKLQHFLKLLQKQPDKEKITDLIYISGYYDHAHLNRNFKKMTGFTPFHYKHTNQMLAINLMRL
ncbi:helix-turn-helix transcriptional regulator [Pedobacter sp. UBA5917]|jgi:AraC-like DNA-binding protein|uniref:helix-turn-helix transcriptional regulator n=1 Tax=Pedobacter sp. UBA5917 TaxID=1947061 RepID=UPI0025D7B1C3|nr:helix-turn-helix transcriptional regulator [Pedobacter sp. UBA5917]